MATSAEQLYQTETDHTQLNGLLIDLDSHEVFADQRQQSLAEAMGKLVLDRQLLRDGDFEAVPHEVNALGTVSRYRKAQAQFGEHSYQALELRRGLAGDNSRLIMEIKKKYVSAYYPEVFQSRDSTSGNYSYEGIDLSEAVVNGLSPLSDTENQEFRIYDYVDEATNKLIGTTSAVRNGTVVMGFSLCTDSAINTYKADQKVGRKRSYGGQVPEIEKWTLERFHFTDSGRFYDQFAVSGKYITKDIIIDSLKQIEALDEAEQLDRAGLRSKRFAANDPEAFVMLMSLLDQNASEATGENLFMGEIVEQYHPKDYRRFMESSSLPDPVIEQQEALLADFQMELHDKGVDSPLAGFLIEDFVKEMIYTEVENNPELAAIIFDQETANRLQKIKELDAAGVDTTLLRKQAFALAPPVSFCGAGACGLEAVLAGGVEEKQAQSLGLVGPAIKDALRACKSCNTLGGVFYDSSASKVCINCKSTEIKHAA